MNIQAWDKDIIASNDLIGDFQLDIGPLVEDVFLTSKMKSFNRTYWDDYMKKELVENRDYEFAEDIVWDKDDDTKEKFWVPMKRYNEEEKETVNAGEVLCSFRIMPLADAEKNDQGIGRAEPNNDPFCPEPEGRIKLSLNPFEMFA